MLGESWTDIKQSELQKNWKHFISNPEVMEKSENGDSSEDEDNFAISLSHLLNKFPVAETTTVKDVSDWLNEDKQSLQ